MDAIPGPFYYGTPRLVSLPLKSHTPQPRPTDSAQKAAAAPFASRDIVSFGISSFIIQQTGTEFNVEVAFSNEVTEAKRRTLEEFTTMHRTLKAALPGITLPEPPAPVPVFIPNANENQQMALDKFMRDVLAIKGMYVVFVISVLCTRFALDRIPPSFQKINMLRSQHHS